MEIRYSGQFKQDYMIIRKRGWDLVLLQHVMLTLSSGKTLETRYYDHPLSGDYEGFRECYIRGDWLLIYKKDDSCLRFHRTGSHSDLFG